MAPEWVNDKFVNYQAGIWAVGALLLELRSGHRLNDEHGGGLTNKSSHSSTLQDMRQSAAYGSLTEVVWE
jgi:hypothetical protein